MKLLFVISGLGLMVISDYCFDAPAHSTMSHFTFPVFVAGGLLVSIAVAKYFEEQCRK